MARIGFTQLRRPPGKQGILRPDGQGYYEQIIGGLNIDNSAGMRYTAEQSVLNLFDGSSTFKRKIARGVLFAENGHPKLLPGMSKAEFINRLYQIHEENTCAHFKDVWVDNTLVKNPDGSPIWAILAKFTPSGEKGHFVEKQLKNGDENVFFSIRSITEDYTVRGKIHRDITEIVTFDKVNEGGIHIADKWDSPALESYSNRDDILVTRQDFEKAFDLAITLGVATESSILGSKDVLFKQFNWTKPNKAPGYMSLRG